MIGKKLNYEALLENISILIFIVSIYYVVSSGKYLSYVTPRMKPYLYFTIVVMLIWFITNVSKVFKMKHRQRVAHCFVLILPILFLLMPHQAISANDLTTGFVTMNSKMSTVNLEESPSTTESSKTIEQEVTSEESMENEQISVEDMLLLEDQTIIVDIPLLEDESSTGDIIEPVDNAQAIQVPVSEDGYMSKDSYGNAIELHGYNEETKDIFVSNEEFYPWINEIYNNVDFFVGYHITITGFVFRDEEFMTETQFVPGRLLMTCCAADLMTTGMVCQYEDAANLELDDWVTVEGTIIIGQYNGFDEPEIQVIDIKEASPVDAYVYPI